MSQPDHRLGRNRLALKNDLNEETSQTNGPSVESKVVLGANDEPEAMGDLDAEGDKSGQDEKAEDPNLSHESINSVVSRQSTVDSPQSTDATNQ
jgi:hypothetical protein